jgi:hypothetical protein
MLTLGKYSFFSSKTASFILDDFGQCEFYQKKLLVTLSPTHIGQLCRRFILTRKDAPTLLPFPSGWPEELWKNCPKCSPTFICYYKCITLTEEKVASNVGYFCMKLDNKLLTVNNNPMGEKESGHPGFLPTQTLTRLDKYTCKHIGCAERECVCVEHGNLNTFSWRRRP